MTMIILTVGFNIGVRGRSSYVICRATEKQIYQAEPGRTEWVTVVECICGDGSTIPPLVIFKGQTTVQTAWIPPDMDKDWNWACNSKGWTCNAIGEEWIRGCFEPSTRNKANGATRLLIADGHGSHVTAPFIRFCIDHDIIVLLLPLHSSHLTQPLDVGIFSPLKQKMAQQLDCILRYGVSNLKKFKWANSYRIARPVGMTASNIESAWSGAGLFPYMPQKVIRRLKAGLSDTETAQLMMSTAIIGTPPPPSPQSNRFNLVPATPSQLDSTVLRSANEVLLNNIRAGILDTPTRAYIPKLAALSEQLRATNILVQHHLEELGAIVKKRKVMVQGKRVVLKDQVLVTTEKLYEKVKAAEEATKNRKQSSGRGKTQRASGTAQTSIDNVEEVQEENAVVILDEIEVLVA